MADVKISGLPVAGALTTSDVLPVVQASTTKQASMSQVATSVFGQNGVVSALPAAGTLISTDVTNVVASGVAAQATMTQLATSVYGSNTGLTTLPNATSVSITDTTVVAQAGTNREATMTQIAASTYINPVWADGTTLSEAPGSSLLAVDGTTSTIAANTNNFAANITLVNDSNTATNYYSSSAFIDNLGLEVVAACIKVDIRTATATYTPIAMGRSVSLYTAIPPVGYIGYIVPSFTSASGSNTGPTGSYMTYTITNNTSGITYASGALLNYNTTVYGATSTTGKPTFKIPSAALSKSVTATSTSGTFAGTNMTVAGTIVGSFTVGMAITGAGVAATTIVSGPADGQAGVYVMSVSQGVGAVSITGTGTDPNLITFLTGTGAGFRATNLRLNILSSNYTGGGATTGFVDFYLIGIPTLCTV